MTDEGSDETQADIPERHQPDEALEDIELDAQQGDNVKGGDVVFKYDIKSNKQT